MPDIPDEAVEAAEKVLKGNYWVEDYYAGRGEIAELAQATLEAAAPFLAAQEREARERFKRLFEQRGKDAAYAEDRVTELEAALEEVRAELAHGITANLEHIDRVIERACSQPSTPRQA